MKYTVIGFFENNDKAKVASSALSSGGFKSDAIDVSPSRIEGDYKGADYEYTEDNDSSGFWDFLFGDDNERRDTMSKVGTRNTVVTLYAETRAEADRAAHILDENGAINIDEKSRATDSVGTDIKGDKSIPVVKEEIAVGKREIETGGINVRSIVVEKPVQENIRLRKERVYVTRKPVDRPVSTETAFDDKVINVTEHNEEAVVEKTARVVEEVTVGKEVEEVTDTIKDTLRETEIEIDESTGRTVVGKAGHKNPAGTAFQKDRLDRAFVSADKANEYYDFLVENGYSTDDITVMMSEETKETFYAGNDHVSETGEEALKGAGTGAAIGGTVGALVGALATAGGALLIPGLGLAVAGPIAAALTGAGVGGGTGAVTGALVKAGVSDSLATEYRDTLDRGEIIISVNPKDDKLYDSQKTYGRELYNGYKLV